jgi:hypothetical protein
LCSTEIYPVGVLHSLPIPDSLKLGSRPLSKEESRTNLETRPLTFPMHSSISSLISREFRRPPHSFLLLLRFPLEPDFRNGVENQRSAINNLLAGKARGDSNRFDALHINLNWYAIIMCAAWSGISTEDSAQVCFEDAASTDILSSRLTSTDSDVRNLPVKNVQNWTSVRTGLGEIAIKSYNHFVLCPLSDLRIVYKLCPIGIDTPVSKIKRHVCI